MRVFLLGVLALIVSTHVLAQTPATCAVHPSSPGKYRASGSVGSSTDLSITVSNSATHSSPATIAVQIFGAFYQSDEFPVADADAATTTVTFKGMPNPCDGLPKIKSKTSKSGTPAPTAAQTDYTLHAGLPYCDLSLPYDYTAHPRDVVLKLQAKSRDWAQRLNDEMDIQEQKAHPGSAPAFHPFTTSDDPVFASGHFKNFNVDDPPAETKNSVEFQDAGLPLLANPTQAFNANTFGVQRLVVRSAFGPDPFSVACAYAYLNAANPPPTKLLGTDGAPAEIIGQGASYHFSLKDATAPDYYLINVVHWADAKPPAGASAPFFQAADDQWYLLNYKDARDRKQDITKLFRPVTPELLSSALHMLGSQSVMLLGIQLAPPAPTLTDAPFSHPFTEQAWFDDISIDYKVHTDAATSAQMQDLQGLVSELLSYVGVTPPASQAVAPAIRVGNAPPARHACAVPPTLLAETKTINKQIEGIDRAINTALDDPKHPPLTPLYLYLRGAPRLDVPRPYGEAMDKQAYLSLHLPTHAASDERISPQVDPETDDSLHICNPAPQVLAANLASLKADEAALAAYAQALAANAPILVSTYQGLYTAGVLANMASLPMTITPTWTASFHTKVAQQAPATPAEDPAAPKPSPKPARMPPQPPPAPHGPSVENDLSAFLVEPPSLAADVDAPTPQAPQVAPPPKQDPGSTTSQSADPPAPPATICTVGLGTADKTTQAPCTMAQKLSILNEGRSWWDISVGVSVTGYKDVTINGSSTGTGSTAATTTTVSRENAYGMADLFLVPEDLNNPPALGWPHLIAALPFAGQVFDKPYFAVGETINIPKIATKAAWLKNAPGLNVLASDKFPLQLRPTFGYTWNKEATTNASGVKTTARNFRPQWTIEIPFRSLVNATKLLAKSSSK